MDKFAKMFDSSEYGQVVAIFQSDEEESKPEIRFFCKPRGLGVCSVALGYEDSDDGWDKAEENFDRLDCAFAEKAVKPVFDIIE